MSHNTKYHKQLKEMFGHITDDTELTELAVALTDALAEISVYVGISIPEIVIGLTVIRNTVNDSLNEDRAKMQTNALIKKVFPNADLV